MNPKSIFFAIAAIIIFSNCQQSVPIRQVNTPDAELLISKTVVATRENHFNPRILDDVFSNDFFEYFIETLDPQKEFFTQKDLNSLNSHRLNLDDAIKTNNFDFFNTAISKLEYGIAKAEKYSNELLVDISDFSINESLEINFSKLNFASSDKALKERWRKKLKKYLLDQIYLEEINNPSLSQEKLLSNAKENVQKLLGFKFDNLKNIKDVQRIEEYANSFLKVHDYQSQYLSMNEKSVWDDKFTRSSVGIGARLVIENGYPKVTETLIGGPAWKSNLLEVNDVILQIKEENSTAIDLIGKPILEVISLIKGKQGTPIYLTVKNKDALISEVVIVRDKIEFDLAMSFILEESSSQNKIGYIRLPRFYTGDPGSAAHVSDELEILKANNVKGIVFDVRDNKGGSAGECRELLSYFLEEGIYMQTKRANGETNQLFSENSSQKYLGELLVLTNSNSGSASELFSGTLQDYNRALIVGSASTYGKGSMQNFIEINDSQEIHSKLGEVKMTVGLFYTASGRSPQSKGITPDIYLTDDSKYIDYGEKGQRFAIPPDALAITKVSQNINQVKNINTLKAKSKLRTQSNPRFLLADEKAKSLLRLQESNLVPLNRETYMNEKELASSLQNEWDEIYSEVKDFNVSFDKRAFESDSVAIITRERWINKIKSDPYIYECFKIANDMIG